MIVSASVWKSVCCSSVGVNCGWVGIILFSDVCEGCNYRLSGKEELGGEEIQQVEGDHNYLFLCVSFSLKIKMSLRIKSETLFLFQPLYGNP